MKQAFLVMLLAGGLVGSVQAGSKDPASFIPIVNYLVQDTSRWEIYQDNRGLFVRPLPGSQPGAFWPKHTGRNYIFGAGLWVGALDTTDRDTVVAQGYDLLSGGSMFGPCLPNGDTTGAMTDSLARIYRSDIPRDTAQWSERDSLGRAVYYSDQELWAIYSGLYDLRPGFPPVGVTCLRRSLAWHSPGPWGDITKMEFEVKNITGRWQGRPRTLRKMIVGFAVDADIGNESSTNANDLCFVSPSGGSTYPNLAVQYQLAQEGGWGPPGPPYQVGLRFVEGPVNNTRDTIRVRSQPGIGYPQYDHDILPGQPLGMTAFQIYSLAPPSTPGSSYLWLSGRYWQTPQILNSYQKDIVGPADKRFIFACGPFDLPNDSVAKFVIHIIGASDSLDLIRKAELLGVESPPGPVARSASDVVLYPSIPNPARGSCLIRYALPEPFPVTLRVYDVSGRLVRELVRGERSAGSQSVSWDGRDVVGNLVASGVYLYRLEVSDKSWVKKTVLLR